MKFLVNESRVLNGKRIEASHEKPATVDLPSNKFVIKKDRYLGDGRYVTATPEAPAVIELPEGTVIDLGLEPYKRGAEEGEKLQPAHAVLAPSVVTAAEAAVKEEPQGEARDPGSKRPSDKKPY